VEVTDDEAGEPSKAPSPKVRRVHLNMSLQQAHNNHLSQSLLYDPMQAKVNPASSPPGAVHKPAAGDQTKKSGKSSSAGAQRSIASFFSKK